MSLIYKLELQKLKEISLANFTVDNLYLLINGCIKTLPSVRVLKFEQITKEIGQELLDCLQEMENLESLSFALCESTQSIFRNVKYHFPFLKVLGVKD